MVLFLRVEHDAIRKDVPQLSEMQAITKFPTRKAIDGSGLDLQQESKSEEDVDEEEQGDVRTSAAVAVTLVMAKAGGVSRWR